VPSPGRCASHVPASVCAHKPSSIKAFTPPRGPSPVSLAWDTSARPLRPRDDRTYTARPMPRLLISCGEASGDLYGAELVRHLRERIAALEVVGLGGDRLQAEGASLFAHVRDLAVVGLLEVVSHLRHLRGVFRRVLADADR